MNLRYPLGILALLTAAGNGLLVVPAGHSLTAYQLSGK
jgi:hypothetical protein